MVFNATSPGGAAASYEIDESCRFNISDSAYMTRTPGGAGNTKTGTISFWIKRCKLGADQQLFHARKTSGASQIRFSANDTLYFRLEDTGGNQQGQVTTNRLFRDVGSWYHIVCNWDTTDSTAGDRMKIFVNGVEETSFSADVNPAEDDTQTFFDTAAHFVGSTHGPADYLGAYLAEIYIIDGTAYAASSFGETNSDTGQWIPKSVSGLAFGTNGAYFDFADSSNLGNDANGGTDWTESGLAANDQVVDTPTDNFCTLNPILPGYSGVGGDNITYSNGNLDPGRHASSFESYFGTMPLPSTGKWYWEVTAVGHTAAIGASAGWDGTVGIGALNLPIDNSPYDRSDHWEWGNAKLTTGGQKSNGSNINLYPAASLEDNGIVQIAVDMDNSKIWWGVNNSWMGTDSGDNDGNPATGANPAYANVSAVGTSSNYLFPCGNRQDDYHRYNFGQLGFAHTPPTGFKALSTKNLPDPTIVNPADHFDVDLYTGTGSSHERTLSFQPDLIWPIGRTQSYSNKCVDSARGVTKWLYLDDAQGEDTYSDILTSFDSDGYTLGTSHANTSSETYVAYAWNEGATPGFDIVTYTGNATNRTISHAVGAVPRLMIIKSRSASGGWAVYEAEADDAPATVYILLDTTATKVDDATFWQDTDPTSSVFTLGTNATVNANTETFVAYLWSEVESFSAFGRYEGNGSAAGPMCCMPFKPRMVITKRLYTDHWSIQDSARNPYNVANARLELSDNGDEATNLDAMDFLSNGFKIRGTDSMWNANGYHYIYMAWAESPLKYATAR